MIRLLLAALLLALSTEASAANTLITNANGYTLDEGGKLRRFAGLLVGDDGRVLALLSKSAKEPKLDPGDFRLDAGGRALIPGLIDADMRLMRLGQALRQLDLADAATPAEVRARLAERAARQPASSWVLGQGWNGPAPDGPLPDPGIAQPAWLVRAGGWMGWANGAALAAAGIGRETPDPPGGQILRDEAGNPNGLFLGSAMELIERHIPPPSAGEREQALAAALARLAALGWTGVHDMGTTLDDWQLYRNFADEGLLTIRITAYADGMAAMEKISPLRPTPSLYDGRLKLAGIHLRADGSLEGRGALLLQPYADAPESSGVQLLDDARQKNLFSRANFLGYQLAVRATGDGALRQALDSFSDIRPSYGDDFRNRIEGLTVADPADTRRLADLHILAAVQPATFDAEIATARLGSERLAIASQWAKLRRAKARLALGTGAPDAAPDAFAALAGAVSAMSLPQALAGFTTDAAYAGHAEAEVGRLAVGHQADFLLLDRDPFAIRARELPQVTVLETWLAGQRVYQRQP